MKELIHSHRSRLLVYFTISAQAVMLIYGSLQFGIVEQRVRKLEINDASLQSRMHDREVVAAKYVPMLEGIKTVVDQHIDILKRIMDRQRMINNIIEQPLKKKK